MREKIIVTPSAIKRCLLKLQKTHTPRFETHDSLGKIINGGYNLSVCVFETVLSLLYMPRKVQIIYISYVLCMYIVYYKT